MRDPSIDDFAGLVPPVLELQRVGPIFDETVYINSGLQSVSLLRKFAYLEPRDNVLDIGCGYGRVAIHLTKILAAESRYLGLDVAQDEVAWCTENITPRHPNFEFRHVNAFNAAYNPDGIDAAAGIRLPVSEENQFDLVFLFSVFTHMLPADVRNYMMEANRVLRPNGVLFATFFLINDVSSSYMESGQSEFEFLVEDGYYVQDRTVHERAVAYDETAVNEMLDSTGFTRDKVIYGHWMGRKKAECGQDIVVCTKTL